MRGYFRHINPGGAVGDMRTLWRENPHRWGVLLLSMGMTGLLFYGFAPKSQLAEPRPPKITWITTFDPKRTQAEIIESNRKNQLRKEYIAALEAERVELRKQLYRELGRATFLDVDAMEAQIRRDEEAAAAAKAKPPSGK